MHLLSHSITFISTTRIPLHDWLDMIKLINHSLGYLLSCVTKWDTHRNSWVPCLSRKHICWRKHNIHNITGYIKAICKSNGFLAFKHIFLFVNWTVYCFVNMTRPLQKKPQCSLDIWQLLHKREWWKSGELESNPSRKKSIFCSLKGLIWQRQNTSCITVILALCCCDLLC